LSQTNCASISWQQHVAKHVKAAYNWPQSGRLGFQANVVDYGQLIKAFMSVEAHRQVGSHASDEGETSKRLMEMVLFQG